MAPIVRLLSWTPPSSLRARAGFPLELVGLEGAAVAQTGEVVDGHLRALARYLKEAQELHAYTLLFSK